MAKVLRWPVKCVRQKQAQLKIIMNGRLKWK